MEMTTVTVDSEHLGLATKMLQDDHYDQYGTSRLSIKELKNRLKDMDELHAAQKSTAEFQKRRKGLKQTIKRRERTLAKQVASRKPQGTSRNAQRGTPPDEEDEEAVEEDLNKEQRLEQEVDEPEKEPQQLSVHPHCCLTGHQARGIQLCQKPSRSMYNVRIGIGPIKYGRLWKFCRVQHFKNPDVILMVNTIVGNAYEAIGAFLRIEGTEGQPCSMSNCVGHCTGLVIHLQSGNPLAFCSITCLLDFLFEMSDTRWKTICNPQVYAKGRSARDLRAAANRHEDEELDVGAAVTSSTSTTRATAAKVDGRVDIVLTTLPRGSKTMLPVKPTGGRTPAIPTRGVAIGARGARPATVTTAIPLRQVQVAASQKRAVTTTGPSTKQGANLQSSKRRRVLTPSHGATPEEQRLLNRLLLYFPFRAAKDFQYLSGVPLSFFTSLLNRLAPSIVSHSWDGREGLQTRRNSIAALSPELELFLALHRLRHGHTLEHTAIITKQSKATLSRSFAKVTSLLSNFFQMLNLVSLPSPSARRLHHNVIYSEDTEIALIVDGSHQPILKPSDKNTRCGYWSGKEQDYTILILAFITPTGWVSSLSGSFPGSIGDKGIWNVLGDDGPWNALESWEAICGDKGFVGIEHDHRAVVCKKAPKNGTLSEADIMENSYVSSLRVRVENTFARMKQWKACRQRRKKNLASHQQMWNVIASLVNLAWLGWDLSIWESGEDELFFSS